MKKKMKKKMTKEEEFWALSESDRRITIAKDVLKALNEGKLIAKERVYLRAFLKPTKAIMNPSGDGIKSEIQVNTVLKKLQNCTACAIGSVFTCAALRADRLKIMKINYTLLSKDVFRINVNSMQEYLRRFFSLNQLSIIECAFECNSGFGNAAFPDRWKAMVFGEGYRTAYKRMQAIMRNIVKNDGEFKP